MKTFCREILVVVTALSLSSCFPIKDLVSFTGFNPVFGGFYDERAHSGFIVAEPFGGGVMLTNLAINGLGNREFLATGVWDGGSSGGNYTRQYRAGLGSIIPGAELLDATPGPNNSYLGSGTNGGLYSIFGDEDECFRQIETNTMESIRTVSWGEEFDTIFAAGDNGTVLSGGSDLIVESLTIPGLTPATHFIDSTVTRRGFALMSDTQVIEAYPSPGGGFTYGFAEGIDKTFKSIIPWGDYYMVLAVDNKSGGLIVLERTATGFDFVPEFGSIFTTLFCMFSPFGDQVAFIREDEGDGSTSTVQLIRRSDGQVMAQQQFPLSIDGWHAYESGFYYSGVNEFDERQIGYCDFDLTNMRRVTPESREHAVKASVCLLRAHRPHWGIHGEDADPTSQGYQYDTYGGGLQERLTLIGDVENGVACAIKRISPQLALVVGNGNGEPLIFADYSKMAVKLQGNGLEGRLNSIHCNPDGTCLVSNEAGDVFSTDLTGADSTAALNALQWKKEATPKVDGSVSTSGGGTIYYKEDTGNDNEKRVLTYSHRSWASRTITLEGRLNAILSKPDLTIMGLSTGYAYLRKGTGEQGFYDIDLGGTDNYAVHQLAGDPAGSTVYALTGDLDDPSRPCPLSEIVHTPTGMVQSWTEVDYTSSNSAPKLGYSAGFATLGGNRGRFGLHAEISATWPAFAERHLGDSNIPPNELNQNGVSHVDQAIFGSMGPQAEITQQNGVARVGLWTSPLFPCYTVKPRSSSNLLDYDYDSEIRAYWDPTGSYDTFYPIGSSSWYFRYDIDIDLGF